MEAERRDARRSMYGGRKINIDGRRDAFGIPKAPRL